MERKILVAGAGHGGLTAAVTLAKNNYDVTVIEQNDRENLGYDWHDAVNMSAFDMSGIPRPQKDKLIFFGAQRLKNPSGTVEIDVPNNNKDGFYIDRKVLISHLINYAEKVGVKFLFSHKVLYPITHENKVTALNVSDGKRTYIINCDLVIDAAGMDSPVRKNLPKSLGITKDLNEKDIFHVYRVYFKNNSGAVTTPYTTINVFHLRRPGIDWTITQKDYVDILIGKFGFAGELTQNEVDETIDKYRQDYPFISKEKLRGGQFAHIPLTKMLPMLVCDGYAAVGDSAGMTIPLSGSGITLSMKAGRLLADTVINSKGNFTKEELWKYEYEYFQRFGKELIIADSLKNISSFISAKQIDFLAEKKLITSDTLNFALKSLSTKQVKNLIRAVPQLSKLIPPLFFTFKSYPLLPVVSRYMPEKYDEDKVKAWTKLYSKI